MRPDTRKFLLKNIPAVADLLAFAVSSVMTGMALSILAGAVDVDAFRDAAAFAFLLSLLLIPREKPELAVQGFDSVAFVRLAGRVAAVAALTFALTILTGEGVGVFPLEIWGIWIIAGTGCLVVARALARSVAAALYRRKLVHENVVIVCAGAQGVRLAEWLRRRAPHIRVLGFFEDRRERVDTGRLPAACLGGIADAVAYCRANPVDRVFVALSGMAEARIAEILETLGVLPVTISMSPDLAFLGRSSAVAGEASELPVFDLQGRPIEGWRAVVKRAEDVVVALVALVVFSPLFVLIPILVKLESPGPVLRRERRYGFGCVPFDLLNFRIAYLDQPTQGEEGRVEFQTSRMTGLGGFLRWTGMERLPQILNVLNGDMSAVGPQSHADPVKGGERPYEEIVRSFARRYRVKPGLTGWAQINGARGDPATPEDLKRRFALDLHYIQNWSPGLDLAILLRALIQGVSGRTRR